MPLIEEKSQQENAQIVDQLVGFFASELIFGELLELLERLFDRFLLRFVIETL